MKSKILVAHNSNPNDFQHEIDIEFFGNDCTDVIDDIIKVLNKENFRDCIFKIEETIDRKTTKNN